MVAAGMGRSPRRRALLAGLALAAAVAGCGEERQDADAPEGEFRVEVVSASFPERQRIAEAATLRLEVANRGERAVPDLAVTVATDPAREGEAPVAFGQRSPATDLADTARPVWIVDEGPEGGDSAYADTWALGPLDEGTRRTIRWRVTAVQAGTYTLNWRVAPALVGDATLAPGRTEGAFDVTIRDDPVPARVGEDGEVVRGEEAGR